MPLLNVGKASIAFTDTGPPPRQPNAATVIFGHGLLFSGRMFAAQIEALRADYRCVTIDWRGQGQSPRAVSGGYDMDTLTGDVRALIDHLNVGPVHYVGLSMGGFVGQRLAARHPRLVRSLTLLDTSADKEDPIMACQEIALAWLYRLAGLGPVRTRVTKLMFGPAFRASPQAATVIADWVEHLSRSDRRGISAAVFGVLRRHGMHGELGHVMAPTLVMVGADDAATPPLRARKIADLIPKARLEVLPACGHSSTVECPELVATLLTEFLSSVA